MAEQEDIIRAAEFYLNTKVTWEESAEQKDKFTSDHVIYDVWVTHAGYAFKANYQCNPQFVEPEKYDILQSIIRDAAIATDYGSGGFPDFVEDFGTPDSIHKAFTAFQKMQEARDFFSNCEIDNNTIRTLDRVFDEKQENILEVVETLEMKRELEHPTLPEGYHYIEDLKKSIYLSDVEQCAVDSISLDGDMDDLISEAADSAVDVYTANLLEWYKVPVNQGYVQQAIDDGLCEGVQDIDKLIQAGQSLAYSEEISDHIKEIVQVCLYNELIDEGYTAISDELNSEVKSIARDFTIEANNSLAMAWDEVMCAIDEISEGSDSRPPKLTIEEVRSSFGPSYTSSVKDLGEASKQASQELMNHQAVNSPAKTEQAR